MVSSSTPKTVTIIGASVGGLTLALILKRYGIQSRFFELRDPNHDFDGAVSLTPNALRVADSIGAYSRIKNQGFNFEAMTFMTDPEHEITGKLYFGQKDVYGYDGIRITRKVLIHELREMVKEAGIEIHYGKKFTKVISEDGNGVEFEFADGTRERAEMLIGADGIHSKVRSYLFPDINPHYGGFLGLTYCFPRANVQLDDGFPLPVSLRGKHGSFIITPQAEGGQEIFVGRQYKYEPKDRAGWSAMLRDKQEVIDMLQRDPTAWTPLVQCVQAQASTPDAHFLNVWPFYTVPKMDRWHSSTGKVVILGDAAHAIPPSAGQGANQAFEDAYSFGTLLATLNGKDDGGRKGVRARGHEVGA
ncbi:Monooxygenase FAD-binding [Penicillium cf. griseofulvum]|uniref:Monooxygenase FAD-binding n=1 Tax=Penicillium cf. griseofulvum TaxID=2972120 RepID=A0A9W9IZY3_9EURO|nr:Monooxygenase FAD-binding [Penicillium cf. griseofulvum]KAJ5422939.1 Monooxygenase FAD-binding [Penicillium cf. griseofulvum]KAJ5433844.1 Monooxygenase FAD-binding [Penicillium cf. griseofulvum]